MSGDRRHFLPWAPLFKVGNVTDRAYNQMLRLLTLALAAVWMITVTAAGAAVVPAMHCPANMPCCPLSHSNTAQCVASECIEQIPQKAEARLDVQLPLEHAAAPIVGVVQPSPSPAAVPELHPGLRFQAAVFRLKDDFRI